MKRKRLGEMLADEFHITPEDLRLAIKEQSGTTALLGEILLQTGKVKKRALVSALESLTRSRYFDCSAFVPDTEVLALVPRALAERYCLIPIRIDEGVLQLAMAEPQNLPVLDEVRFLTGMRVHAWLGFHKEIVAAIAQAYRLSTSDDILLAAAPGKDEIEFVSTSLSESAQAALREFQAELRGTSTPAVRILSNIIRIAIDQRASDIHIEQSSTEATVRIRIDGVLRELSRVPAEVKTQLVSRVKILADMDIAERRISQDGRFLASVGERQVDMRVSTLPTQYGEKVVMRLLDSSAASVPFEKLGFSLAQAEQLYRLLAAPQGMILVTGPTGSGKSTTLYSALNYLRSPKVNITTIEDPVEYVIEGVNQVQVNAKAGRTFASCLRSMLRQDPNVVMVGEIRDGETAEIALTAAQTGHLVLSTLHTNDAISAITRLADLDVLDFLIASSVTAIIAQRLVRKLCSCRAEVPATKEYLFKMRRAGFEYLGEKTFVPVGCNACDRTGYKGRIGVYELLVINEQLRAAIRDGREAQLRTIARMGGFQSMREDALQKLTSGLTTLDEVRRVVPLEHSEERLCEECEQFLVADFNYCPRCGMKVPEPQQGPQTVMMPSSM